MADEYFERYKRLSHQELYQMLRVGNVRQVAAVADTWGSIADTLAALSATLTRDLDRLARSWTGNASREFSVRLSLVSEFAKTLAADAAAIRTGLNVMAGALREAQRQAEKPLPDNQREPGELPAVLGTSLGWAQPAYEAKRAQERMAWLVARLAAEYGVVAHGTWPSMLSEPPIGLPGVDDVVHHVHDRHTRRPHGTILAAAEHSPVRAASLPAASAVTPVRHEQWQPGGLASTPSYVAESTRASNSSSSSSSSAGSSSSSTSPAGGNQAAVPMAPAVGMAGTGPVPGAVPMVTPVTPTNLAWQTAEHVDWSDHDTDAPPSVLGT
jgi:uncharacterized protein YukE